MTSAPASLLSGVKGPASGKDLLPLPAHKFGPHDIVAIRPSRGEAGGAPLAQGVVYRLHESSLVVAVDEAPDEGLDQPLRLEKLANTVRATHHPPLPPPPPPPGRPSPNHFSLCHCVSGILQVQKRLLLAQLSQGLGWEKLGMGH